MQPTSAGQPLYEERLHVGSKGWGLLALSLFVAFFAVHPFTTVLVVVSWVYSVLRFRRKVIRVDPWWITVGKRHAPLAGLDLSSVSRARNPWPWKIFSPAYLGANPIWTSDSVRIVGVDHQGRKVTVAVGTERRDEMLAVLEPAVVQARQAVGHAPTIAPAAGPIEMPLVPVQSPSPVAPSNLGWVGQPQAGAPHIAQQPSPFQQPANPVAPGWYDDPWSPGAAWRWWDGRGWTQYSAPAYGRWGGR